LATRALEESEMTDYGTNANAERVKLILTESKFNELFPSRDSLYTYDGFIKAVAKYPMFCGEYNDSSTDTNLENLDNACKRELSTLLAHFEINSEGLSL
jgi:hypothetical protein